VPEDGAPAGNGLTKQGEKAKRVKGEKVDENEVYFSLALFARLVML
jgi:hypothetical protein